jgi:DNA-binding MarR family transcriptional regulator
MLEDASSLSDALVDRVSRLSTVLNAAVLSFGVSLPQARALTTLSESGPLKVTELAYRQQVTQPTMTALVSGMERQGWVVRRSDHGDGRVVMVVATSAGEEVVRALRRVHQGTLARHLDRLTAEEVGALEAAMPALEALIGRIEQTGDLALALASSAGPGGPPR